jgi:hypothetical protein
MNVLRLLCVLAAFSAAFAAEAQRPAYVDLRPHQTPVKAQGARGNCFIHGTVAAMEAAYKRQGHGDLDLAEHFSDYVARLLFIETCQFDGRFRTRFMRIPDAWERESGIPMFEHQGGTVDSLVASSPAAVLGLPEERFMPLTDYLFDTGGRPDTDPYWQRQYNVSTHLLDERRLPRSALRAPAYYRVKRVEWLPRADATRPEAIEAILASGREVIWDFRMAGNWDGRIWKYTGPAGDVTTHRMLIVGYDRRDPRNKTFIAKNSWGHPIPNPPGDDFTYIEYDYLKYGEWASWIDEVERPYRMPELAFIGRWDVAFGPHRGTLDVYHVPGLMQPLFDHHLYADERGQRVQDRRLGTFYLNGDPDQPYRVNGALRGEQLEAWIDFDQRAPRWDILKGWKLVMTLDRAGERMNGRATPPAGRAHDAAATRVPIRTEAPAPAASHTKEEPLAAEAAIHAKWQATGGLDFLGAPVTGVETCPDGLGRYTHYERGSIYWSPRTPPSVIYGAIRDRWAALGWETGPLGYPTSDELDSGDGGRHNTFERGRILWHPHKGAWEERSPEKTDTPDFTTSVK